MQTPRSRPETPEGISLKNQADLEWDFASVPSDDSRGISEAEDSGSEDGSHSTASVLDDLIDKAAVESETAEGSGVVSHVCIG